MAVNLTGLPLFLNKVYAFIKRGAVSMVSYRTGTVLNVLSTIGQVITFYLLGRMFAGQSVEGMQPYGGDYVAFVVIGVAFNAYTTTSINSFNAEIRREQLQGTLESVLMSPTKISTVLIASSIWSFIFTSINMAVALLTGFALGVDYGHANLASATVVLLLMIVSMSGIGMMSAGVIMITKQGDPVTWIFNSLMTLFSGTYFPVEVIPQPFRSLSYALPLYYGLHGLRLSILTGATVIMVWEDLLALTITSFITIPLGIGIFAYGFIRARKEGSLIQY